jgi:hypothetical protein
MKITSKGAPKTAGNVINLMDALKKSLNEVGKRLGRQGR